MAIIVLPELPANQWNLLEWLEKIASREPGGQSGFSTQDSESSLMASVPANKMRSFINQVLGYSVADDAAPWRLRRYATPIQHPFYPYLWADSISVQKYGPLGQLNLDSGGNLAIQAKEFTDGFGYPYSPQYYGRYGMADATVHFKPLKAMRYISDNDSFWNSTKPEYLRMFGRERTDIALDLITVEGATEDSQVYFAEGTTGGIGSGPVTGPTSVPFGGAVFTRKEKATFHMVWKQVPMNYTCGEINFTDADIASFNMPLPNRLLKALGTLNLTRFPGSNSPYLPGMLMLTAVEETVYQQPVRTNTAYGYFACDYAFSFEYFNPTRDAGAIVNPGPSPVDTSVAYGHDLFPSRITRKWYLGTSGTTATRGTQSGQRYYAKTEFADMFQALGNPAYPLPP